MTDTYYEVHLNGMQNGKRSRSTLYYKSESDFLADFIPMMGAEGLAQNIKQEIWDLAMQETLCEDYTLLNIEVVPMNFRFETWYTLPYILPVNESGGRSGDSLPPSACVNIKFNLGAVNALQSPFVPKRGYIALAGVSEAVQDNGIITTAFWNDPEAEYGKIARKLSENIQELTPPAIWVPVRMRRGSLTVEGIQKFLGAVEVAGATVDHVISNRRSRKLGT